MATKRGFRYIGDWTQCHLKLEWNFELQHNTECPTTFLHTPWCRVLLEKLTGLQLVKKYPAFHGTRRFITALTSFRHLSILGQPNPVHVLTSHLLEIHTNIILPFMPRYPKWSHSLRFPHQEPNHPFSSPVTYYISAICLYLLPPNCHIYVRYLQLRIVVYFLQKRYLFKKNSVDIDRYITLQYVV